MTHRWITTLVIGVLVTAGGLIWLFRSLGLEKADHVSSGVGAGLAAIGVLLAVLSLAKGRGGENKPAEPQIRQSVDNTTVNQPVVQIGGNVGGSITTSGRSGTSAQRPDSGEEEQPSR